MTRLPNLGDSYEEDILEIAERFSIEPKKLKEVLERTNPALTLKEFIKLQSSRLQQERAEEQPPE